MAGKGVSSTSDKYDKMRPIWQKCRDVKEGQEAVHDAGTTYLPKLYKEQDLDYKSRLTDSVFFGATGKTIAGLLGLLFRKRPKITIPKGFEDISKDINMAGKTAAEFFEDASDEALTVTRFGILVDYQRVKGKISKADAKKMKLRPYLSMYKAENILDVKRARVDNETIITQVRLRESKEITKGEFDSKTEKRYRVLDIDKDGFYRVRIYKVDNDIDVQLGTDIYPLRKNKKMKKIPFFFFPDVDIKKPVLLDLVNMNISHYRTTSDLEYGCKFSGRPTGFIFGYKKEEDEHIYLGGTEFNICPDYRAKAEYLELESNFEALFKNQELKEKRMAILGSRMLETQKKQSETAEVANVHRAGEASSLQSFSSSLSMVFTRAMQELLEWAGSKEEVSVVLNKDFVASDLEPQTITALLAAVQAGKMSDQAFFEKLKQGEMYKEDVSFEDEQAAIENQSPPMP